LSQIEVVNNDRPLGRVGGGSDGGALPIPNLFAYAGGAGAYDVVAIITLDPVPGLWDARGVGTVCPTVVPLLVFNAVADDTAPAPQTYGSKRLDRAFKAIKGIDMARLYNIERFVVGIVAHRAGSHS